MRAGLVFVVAMTCGACAALVHLDDSDSTGGASSGDDTKQTSSGKASSGSATQSSGQSSSGTSGDAAAAASSGNAEAGADTGTPPPTNVTTCTKQADCANNDRDHDSCTNKGECKKFCVQQNFDCLTLAPDLPCCIGLTCKEGGLGGHACLP